MSGRVREFVLAIEATETFLREAPSGATYVRDMLMEKGHEPLRGPRGGYYEPVNEPHHYEDGPGDFIRGTRLFTARVTGRYVRPSRVHLGERE